MAQNLIEKIAQNHAVGLEAGQIVKSGDFITLQPIHVMTHDNTGAVIPKFKAIGATKIANPRQVVHTLDHNIQDKSWHFGLTPKVGCYFPMGGQTEWGLNFNAKYNYILYNKTGLNNKEWNNLMFFDISLGVMVFF